MPLPLVGLPALGTLISGLFTGAIAWIVRLQIGKIAIFVLIITAVGGLIVGLIDQFEQYAQSLDLAGLGIIVPFLPSNTGTCVSVLISAELVCTGYRLGYNFLKLKLQALS